MREDKKPDWEVYAAYNGISPEEFGEILLTAVEGFLNVGGINSSVLKAIGVKSQDTRAQVLAKLRGVIEQPITEEVRRKFGYTNLYNGLPAQKRIDSLDKEIRDEIQKLLINI